MTRRVKILLVGLAILSGIGALVLLSPSQDAVLERNLAALREHHPETAERLAEVRQTLQSDAPTEGGHGSYGLFNVNKRIQLYYNQPEGVSIESGDNGTTVSFSVPFGRMDDVQGISG